MREKYLNFAKFRYFPLPSRRAHGHGPYTRVTKGIFSDAHVSRWIGKASEPWGKAVWQSRMVVGQLSATILFYIFSSKGFEILFKCDIISVNEIVIGSQIECVFAGISKKSR